MQPVTIKKKPTKPETSIFSLIQSSTSVLTNDSPVYCFPRWLTVDALGRPSEDNKHMTILS